MSEAQHTDGVTRRDLIKKGALFGGTLMWVTPAIQTVGMSRALAETPSDTCIEQYAASVVTWSQGTQYDSDPIPPIRSNPNAALAPGGQFFSLGFKGTSAPGGGTITVMFATPAFIATGSDVLVVETTNNPATYPEEKAKVEVSKDGVTWYGVGTASNQASPAVLDLAGVPVDRIQYVRLTDMTDPSLFTTRPDADAFDVDAIGIACPPQGASTT